MKYTCTVLEPATVVTILDQCHCSTLYYNITVVARAASGWDRVTIKQIIAQDVLLGTLEKGDRFTAYGDDRTVEVNALSGPMRLSGVMATVVDPIDFVNGGTAKAYALMQMRDERSAVFARNAPAPKYKKSRTA